MEMQRIVPENVNSLNSIARKAIASKNEGSKADVPKKAIAPNEENPEETELPKMKKLGDTFENIEESIDLVEKKISSWFGKISTNGTSLMTSVGHYAQRRPLTFLVGALAISVVADRVLFSNRKNHKSLMMDGHKLN